MAVAAIATAIGTYIVNTLPPQNVAAWVTIMLDGFVGGCAVLLGAWVVASKRRMLVVPAAFLLSLILALLFAWQDWFAKTALLGYVWPPDASNWQQMQQLYAEEYATTLWLRTSAVSLAGIFLTSVVVSLFLSLWLIATTATGSTKRVTARSACVALLLLAGIVPMYFVWRLLTPSPIPRVVLPSPNGYDDFVAAGKELQGRSPFLDTAVEPKSTTELAAEIAKFQPTFDRIRLGLSRSSLVPVWPDGKALDLSLALPDIQVLRSIARALMRESELAQQEGRFEDAANIAIENIRFGHESSRGGLLINLLVGVAIEGIGQASLYDAIPKLELAQSRDVMAALDRIERTREPLADVIARVRIWEENATGWHGHLYLILEDLTQADGGTAEMVRRDVVPRVQAINQMMMVELALRQYKKAHEEWPDNLDILVPRLLPRVPVDPYDPAAGELRYFRTADGYPLYSVGCDGDDDQGRRPEDDEFDLINWRGDGDLAIVEFFAEQDALDERESANAGPSESESRDED